MNTIQFRAPCPREAVVQRLAHFRRVALKVDTDLEADLAEWFGFSPRHARIVAALYGARAPLDRAALMRNAEVTAETLRLGLAAIREALGPGALPPAGNGRGYQLTLGGHAECERAVSEVGMDRVRELLGIKG